MAEGKVIFEVQMTTKGAKQLQKTLDQTNKSTQNTTKSQKKLNKETANHNQLQKGVGQLGMNTTKSFSKMQESMSGSSGLVGAYATLAANVFAATAAFNALKKAAQIQVLIQSLETLGAASGQNLEALSMRVRDAAGGAIDLAQAMQTASVGASAGFDSSQLDGLTKVAKAAALALGRDVGDAIDRVTRGAAKLEPEILDELGIFVRVDDAAAKYAATLGKTANELNRFEKRMAFANEIIDQGTDKFGELFDQDVSSFDKLGASLMDLGRTVTDFFNAVLGPIAGFFAQNQVALLGFMAMITKGIMSQALPALQQFGAKALLNAQQALSNAEKEERASNKVIQSLQKRMTPLKGIGKGYNDLAAAAQKGEGSVKSLQASQKKLADYILGAQKRINAGQVKNIALVEERIRLAKERLKNEKLLSNELKNRDARGGGAPVSAAGLDVKQSQREASIFRNLEKDQSFKGHMKAMKLANRQAKRYRMENKKIGVSNKIMGLSFFGLAKPLNVAKIGIRSFGISAKVAIKGIFTAIPVIGQLLFVIDLLIAGLKGAINFLGKMKGEASELAKAAEQTTSMIDNFADSQSRAARDNQKAGDALSSSANAMNGLNQALEQQQLLQEKANEEMSFFGKVLQLAGQRFKKIAFVMSAAWERFSIKFKKFSLGVKAGIIANVLIPFSRLMNVINKFENKFRSEGNKIPLIDIEGFKKEIVEIENELDRLSNRERFILKPGTIRLLPKSIMDEGSEEIKALSEVLQQGGEATKEMLRNLSEDFDINSFTTALAEGADITSFFSEEFAKSNAVVAFGSAVSQDYGNVQELLQGILKEGTKETTAQGEANTVLTETLKEAKQAMSEFNQTFIKKAAIGDYAATLTTLSQEMQNIIGNDSSGMGDGAIVDALAAAEPGYQRLIGFTDEIKTKQELYNEKIKDARDENGNITEEQRAQIANEVGLGKAIANRAKVVAELAKSIEERQLFAKAEIDAQNRISKGVAKFQKMNETATGMRIDAANKAANITIDAQKLELQQAKETSGIFNEQGQLIKQKSDMTKEELGSYASILDKQNNINKEEEKLIGAKERKALIDQQALAVLNLQEKELQKQFKIVQATEGAKNKFANQGKGKGLVQTPAEELKAEKAKAAEKVRVAEREIELLDEKLRIELLIMEARMKAIGISDDEIANIRTEMEKVQDLARKTAVAKKAQAEAEEKIVALSSTALINSSLQGEQMLEQADLLDERLNGMSAEDIKKNMPAVLAAANDFLSPMRESLKELGPEGELIAMAQEGLFTLAQSFMNTMDVFNDKGAGFGEKLVAGAQMAMQAIGVISQLQQQNSKAQVAEIDKQIEAEKKRDGKSKESIAKMAAMEKKKEMIQRKAFEQKKSMDIAQAVISTALGAARAFEIPLIGPALAAMVVAMGMKQVALIKSQQFSGSSGSSVSAPSTIEVGKRNNSVDTAKGATGGELAFLRGQSGTGSNANNFIPGGAAGMRRGYASGGEILVGERGPEIVKPTTAGYEVIPNDKIGGMSNVNFTINAVDAAGVEQLLVAQKGNIIGMIREAANEHGEEFMEGVNTNAYGGEAI